MLEDLAPSEVVSCATPVALVDDDEIEEVGREFPVDLLRVPFGPVSA